MIDLKEFNQLKVYHIFWFSVTLFSMQKILMSACLLGAKVRYDGGDCEQQNALLNKWRIEGRIITICPEMAGGLPTPRPPAEIIGQGGGEAVLTFQANVMTNTQHDVSDAFRQGAELALALAKKHLIKIAILKANSPSCGNTEIYDGSFSRQKIIGQGVTAALLTQHGIKVFNENQLQEAAEYLKTLE